MQALVQAVLQSVRAGELRVDRRLKLRLKIGCSFFPRMKKIENMVGNCKRNRCVAAGGSIESSYDFGTSSDFKFK